MFKNKTLLSLGKSKNVCGIEIKKQPLGAYLRTLENIKMLPENFIHECFPDKTPIEIVEQFADLNEQKLLNIIASLFVTVPKYVITIIAELVGIDENILLEDENIGLDGIVEIIKVFIELNDLGKFMTELEELKKMTVNKLKVTNTGSND